MTRGTPRHRVAGCLALSLSLVLVLPAAAQPAQVLAAEDATASSARALAASEESTGTLTPVETNLSLTAPATCAAKATVTATATLLDADGQPVAGRTVVIERFGSSVKALGEGLTDAEGRFTARIAPRRKVTLRARFGGDAEYAHSTSTLAVVKPRAQLSRPWTHDAIAYPGQRLPARGTLWPKHSSASTSTIIRCERYEGGTRLW
jgi:hypothetical protein